MSNARKQSTPAALAWFDAVGAPRDMRTSLVTGPAFCERPVWSRPRTSNPSSIAAVPMIWLTVMTPVPPMPDRRTVNRSGSTIGCGSGSVDASGAAGTAFFLGLAAGS